MRFGRVRPAWLRMCGVLLAGGAALAVAAACNTDPAGGCDEVNENNQLENIAVMASADSAPLISWSPAECGVSHVELWRFNNGPSCAPGAGAGSCSGHYISMWRVGTGGLPLTAFPGPPTIGSPVRYGLTPETAFKELGPDSVSIGDTLLLYMARPRAEGQGSAPYVSLIFIVGVGAK